MGGMSGRRAADHFGDRARRGGKLGPRHHRDRGDRDGDIEHRRHAHGEHEAERDGALRVAAFLGDVERVLKADKGEEGEHRALHQDQPFALFDGGRRHLQQVDAAPIREADGNDEDQP